MPNSFAYLALLSWPVVSLIFYKMFRPLVATVLTILGGYLVLPVNVSIDFPLIPPLDKGSISSLFALLACKYSSREKISLIPESGFERWLVVILLISPIITVVNNQEPVFNQSVLVQGLTFHDAISAVIKQYILLIPFILGIALVKSYDDQVVFFKLIVVAGLIYALPILLEIRLSPRLHVWIYGFFPNSFAQSVRYGGFRAVVFLGHGLLVSMFIAIALGAAVTLWRQRIKFYNFSYFILVVLFVILLILNKTLSGFLLGVFLMIVISWMPVYAISRLALFLITMVIIYPILSILELFPHEQFTQLIADIDKGRADSLSFRFFHEGILLDYVKEKFLFGWGGWGRYRLAKSITDGYWIITFGKYGIIGFSAIFGLAALSIWRSAKSLPFVSTMNEQLFLSTHALIVAIIMVDQIPNASLASGFWMWFFIGTLLGRANAIIRNDINYHADGEDIRMSYK